MKIKASPVSLGHRAPGREAALSVCLSVSDGCCVPWESGTLGFCASVHSERKGLPVSPVSMGLGFEFLLEQECVFPPWFTALQRREGI